MANRIDVNRLCFRIIEMPANFVGNGKVFARTGCERPLPTPKAKSVTTCPGATGVIDGEL